MRLNSRVALQCPEYLHKTFAPKCFDLSLQILGDPLPDALKAAGIAFEERVIESIRSLGLKILEINTTLPDILWERETARALLDSDAQIIYGASIGQYCEEELSHIREKKEISGIARVSRPDLLVRLGTSLTGMPVWAPVDIKSHSAFEDNTSNYLSITKLPTLIPTETSLVAGRLQRKDAYQLAHYVRHLQSLGFSEGSTWAGVLGKESDFIAWAQLDGLNFGRGKDAVSVFTLYETDLQVAAQIIEKSQRRNEDRTLEPVEVPRRISGDFGCATCEMRKICRVEMENFDNGAGHVTLLAEVTQPKALQHLNGIESIRDLAKAQGLSDFGMKSVLRAQVWESKIPRLIDETLAFIIPEADIEIDIDLENSQEAIRELEIDDVLGSDLLYLYGFGIHDRTKDSEWESADFGYYDDYKNTDDSEFRVFSQMWQRLEDEVAGANKAEKSIKIFHYSSHERTWWRKYAEKHAARPGTPTRDHIEDFISKYFVDLYPIAQQIAFPDTGYSIKVLAPRAGFNWKASDAGGGNSIVMYQIATSPKSSDQEKEGAISWLREYNRDDIKATFAVRKYLRELSF